MEGHLGAALFTRRAAGRTATPKLALGDTNFELAQTPVNPRRERMDDPEFQTDDARNVEPHKIQAKGTMIPILQDVETLKSRFEAMKGSGDPEKEKALDDITSACDLITHHVLDITEDAGAPKKARLFVRQAEVKMHKTPPKGAPRLDQRTHLDQDLKDELNPKTDDPDLVRHTTGKSAATEAPLLEALSALVHKQWLGWSKGIAEEEDLTDERMDRWEEECWMPYSQLSEEQKEKDRVEARQIIKLLKRRGIELKIEKEAGRLFA